MAIAARQFQSATANTPPPTTNPVVDTTPQGDEQVVKVDIGAIGAAAGSSLLGQVELPTADAAALAQLLSAVSWLQAISGKLPTALTTGGNLKMAVVEDQTGAAFSTTVVKGRVVITDTTSTPVLAAGAAGIVNCATMIVISNSSGTATEVHMQDGVDGTTLFTIPTGIHGAIVPFGDVPLRTTAATALCAKPATALSSITVSVVGFRAA